MAPDRLKKGTRVKLSKKALRMFPKLNMAGTVVTRSQYPGFATVVFDGRRTCEVWSLNFLMLAEVRR